MGTLTSKCVSDGRCDCFFADRPDSSGVCRGKMIEMPRATAANAIPMPATRVLNYTSSPLRRAFRFFERLQPWDQLLWVLIALVAMIIHQPIHSVSVCAKAGIGAERVTGYLIDEASATR